MQHFLVCENISLKVLYVIIEKTYGEGLFASNIVRATQIKHTKTGSIMMNKKHLFYS